MKRSCFVRYRQRGLEQISFHLYSFHITFKFGGWLCGQFQTPCAHVLQLQDWIFKLVLDSFWGMMILWFLAVFLFLGSKGFFLGGRKINLGSEMTPGDSPKKRATRWIFEIRHSHLDVPSIWGSGWFQYGNSWLQKDDSMARMSETFESCWRTKIAAWCHHFQYCPECLRKGIRVAPSFARLGWYDPFNCATKYHHLQFHHERAWQGNTVGVFDIYAERDIESRC